MIRQAVTCDRDDCVALYLEPDANPDARPGLDAEPTRAADVLDFDQLVELAGWVARPAALVRPGLPDADVVGHLCPACAADRGPVLELGECPNCTGRTVDKADGAHCHYCRTVTPHPADDLDDALWDGRGITYTTDGPVVGGDDWS
jgi:hypothetical protein